MTPSWYSAVGRIHVSTRAVSIRLTKTKRSRRHYPCAVVILARYLDPLEQFIDFRAGFFVVMFRHPLGNLVEFLDHFALL